MIWRGDDFIFVSVNFIFVCNLNFIDDWKYICLLIYNLELLLFMINVIIC